MKGGYTDVFELICGECGDHPYLDYREIPPRLQLIRGPYPLEGGLRAYADASRTVQLPARAAVPEADSAGPLTIERARSPRSERAFNPVRRVVTHHGPLFNHVYRFRGAAWFSREMS